MHGCNGAAPAVRRSGNSGSAIRVQHGLAEGGPDMRSILLWLIGIPIPIIILLLIFHVI